MSVLATEGTGMTILVVFLWCVFGAVELQRATAAPSAAAVRHSCEAPTMWGQS